MEGKKRRENLLFLLRRSFYKIRKRRNTKMLLFLLFNIPSSLSSYFSFKQKVKSPLVPLYLSALNKQEEEKKTVFFAKILCVVIKIGFTPKPQI